ncbi:MAG: hypothetical protein AAF211_31650, partial [Myxococcota bacterium]
LVRFGRGQAADTLRVTLRVVGLTDPDAFGAFRDEGQGRVFRLTPVEAAALSPLARAPLRPAVAQPPLEDPLGRVDDLRQALLDAHPEWSILETDLGPLEPPEAVPVGTPPCWNGCNRDLSYENALGTQLAAGGRLWLYGVDPAVLGRSAWTEIMLAGQRENDAAGHAGTDDLRGSAAALDPTFTDEGLFAWAFARDCTGLAPFCSEIRPECPGLASTELGSVLVRHYLDPETGTWPPLAGLGVRRAIKFTPPEP